MSSRDRSLSALWPQVSADKWRKGSHQQNPGKVQGNTDLISPPQNNMSLKEKQIANMHYVLKIVYFHQFDVRWEAGKPGCYVAAAMMAWLWTDVCHTYNALYYRGGHTQLYPENIVGYATHTGLDMRGDSTLGIITAKRRWERGGRKGGGGGVDGLVEECGSLWLLSKAVGDITAQARGGRARGKFCKIHF